MQKKTVSLLLSRLLDVYMAAEGVRTNVQKVPLIMLVVEKFAVMSQNVIAVNWMTDLLHSSKEAEGQFLDTVRVA